jgi:hypothetical protein
MASAERYSGYTASIIHGAALTMNLVQLDSWRVQPNTRKATIIPSGLIDPAHHGVASAAPVIEMTTRDFETPMASIVSPAIGLKLTGAGTFRFQERTDCGTFETGATQETVTTTGGFLYPTGISATQDGEDGATLDMQLVALWDGTTSPLVWNTGVDYTAVTVPSFVARHFMGPVYHAGAEIAGVTSITVDFGIQFEANMYSGDPYPQKGAIVQRNPTMSFTVAKVDVASALTTVFGSAISTGLVFYLWKGVTSADRVAVGTAEHIKITASAGDWALDEASVTGNDDGSVTFTARPTVALAVDTTSAIP